MVGTRFEWDRHERLGPVQARPRLFSTPLRQLDRLGRLGDRLQVRSRVSTPRRGGTYQPRAKPWEREFEST